MQNVSPNTFQYVVLPPEASTNWLFSPNVLFNILLQRKSICMDREDFRRYKRLASKSDLDFLKYFLLTLLCEMKILHLEDYRVLCSTPDISKMLAAIQNSRLLRDTKRYENIVFSGYQNYLDYISAKERVLPYIGNTLDKEAYRREQIAAERDLTAINRGLFPKEDRRSYLRRLSTKLLTAQMICKKINGTILDSREYQRGATLLKAIGLFSENTIFDGNLYNRSKSFDQLISICERNNYLELSFGSLLAEPGFVNIWLPFVFLQTLSKQDRRCISRLEKELQEKTKPDLGAEIYDWLLANKKNLGLLDRCSFAKDAISTAIGFVPVAGPMYSFYRLFQLLFCAHDIRKQNISSVAQLIGVALMTELSTGEIDMKYSMHKWIVWFFNIFKASASDTKWVMSQREMGSWTKTDIYVPWYEHSEDRLKQLRLI